MVILFILHLSKTVLVLMTSSSLLSAHIIVSWLAERLAENYEPSMIVEELHKAGQVKKTAGRKPNTGKAPKHPHMKGKCYRCSSTSHRSNKCKVDKISKCSKCSKVGHLAKVCLSAKANSVTSPDEIQPIKTASSTEIKAEQAETCYTVNMSRDYNNTDVPTAML